LRIVEGIFSGAIPAAGFARDAFRYRLTRKMGNELRIVEVAEENVPLAIRNSIKDSLE
jgi:hypothetical protein